jgi:hypothetical protein
VLVARERPRTPALGDDTDGDAGGDSGARHRGDAGASCRTLADRRLTRHD